jgi:hypothetical protein
VTPLRLAIIVGSAVGLTLLLHFWRSLPWTLAGIVGAAMGVLVWSTLNTGDRLRGTWRR